ncbi:MAG: hypothetical protein WC644_01765 [Ignavibacteria bacterium]
MEKILDLKYNDKYDQKKLESFNARLELYLFNLANGPNVKNINFDEDYFINMETKEEYIKTNLVVKCQEYGFSFSNNSLKNIKIDSMIGNWCEVNEEKIENLYKDYEVKYKETLFPKDKFGELLKQNECEYCKISLDEIKKLFEKEKIYGKRYTRGKSLELDRKIPNWEYSKDNTVACCYWCNNAKTDEFFGDEFKSIGLAIGTMLKNRLK